MDTLATPLQIHRGKLPAAPQQVPQALYPSCEMQTSYYLQQQDQKLSIPFQSPPDSIHPSVKSLSRSALQDPQILQTPARVHQLQPEQTYHLLIFYMPGDLLEGKVLPANTDCTPSWNAQARE